MVALTSEQKAFLTQSENDFANRYTMEDEEFKKIYEADIPPPPIMNNWYPRNRRQPRSQGRQFRDRDHGQGNRFNHGRDYDRNYDRSNYDEYNNARERDREDRWDNRHEYRDRSTDRSFRDRD